MGSNISSSVFLWCSTSNLTDFSVRQFSCFQNLRWYQIHLFRHLHICIHLIEVPLFQPCKKHHFGIDKPEKLTQSPDESKFLMKTFSQIKSNVAVPIKKKVIFSVHLMKMSCYLQINTSPFLSFSLWKALKSGFSFLCFISMSLFSVHLPNPVFPCLPGKGKQRERTPGEAAAWWAVQNIHGLGLLLL